MKSEGAMNKIDNGSGVPNHMLTDKCPRWNRIPFDPRTKGTGQTEPHRNYILDLQQSKNFILLNKISLNWRSFDNPMTPQSILSWLINNLNQWLVVMLTLALRVHDF